MKNLVSLSVGMFAVLIGALITQAVMPTKVDEEPYVTLDEPNGRIVLVGKPELLIPERGSVEYSAGWHRLWINAESGENYLYDPKTKKAGKLWMGDGLDFEDFDPNRNLCYYSDKAGTIWACPLGEKSVRKVATLPTDLDMARRSIQIGTDSGLYVVSHLSNQPDLKWNGSSWTSSKWPNHPQVEHPGVFVILGSELNDDEPQQLFEEKEIDPRGQVLQISFSEKGAGEVVTTGVTTAKITPDGKYLFFQSQGYMFMCTLKILSGDAAKEERNGTSKDRTMLAARQVVIALLMYSDDNDDLLPAPDQFFGVEPYVKGKKNFDRFVYTYSGPIEIAKIQNLANTLFGYVLGTSGRANAYADGRVTWVPDGK